MLQPLQGLLRPQAALGCTPLSGPARLLLPTTIVQACHRVSSAIWGPCSAVPAHWCAEALLPASVRQPGVSECIILLSELKVVYGSQAKNMRRERLRFLLQVSIFRAAEAELV